MQLLIVLATANFRAARYCIRKPGLEWNQMKCNVSNICDIDQIQKIQKNNALLHPQTGAGMKCIKCNIDKMK